MDYINEQVRKLDINTSYLPYDEEPSKKAKTGFMKVMDQYRNPLNMEANQTGTRYFYDKNYYNDLKQYKTNYFEPNKESKKKVSSGVGPQYHDNFFMDYYMYLEERNKMEQYYNRFGKRYTFDSKEGLHSK